MHLVRGASERAAIMHQCWVHLVAKHEDIRRLLETVWIVSSPLDEGKEMPRSNHSWVQIAIQGFDEFLEFTVDASMSFADGPAERTMITPNIFSREIWGLFICKGSHNVHVFPLILAAEVVVESVGEGGGFRYKCIMFLVQVQ